MRGFLAAAEAGTLSGAARRLGLSQPTLSRQVAALEVRLGVTLFERAGKSLILTQAGVSLLDHARAMGAAADKLTLSASGHSEAGEGLVSISASDAVAAFLLPAILSQIRREAPGITIEVIASNALSDLMRRETDIAIRHVRPSEPDLIGRLLRDASACFYASREWVARNGHPRSADDVTGADFIGFDLEGRFVEYLAGIGLPLDKHQVPLVSENAVVAWEMVRSGLGIGVMMDEIAARMPDVVRVLDELPVIKFPLWLVTHRELRTARRIRIVYDILAEKLIGGL